VDPVLVTPPYRPPSARHPRCVHPRALSDLRGFTLLEALIAMLVLAVGLLGFMGLQVRGLSYNHDAYVRSMSTLLAYDMIERMRMARANAPSDAVLNEVFNAFIGVSAADAVCQPAGVFANPAAMVTAEKICWESQVQATLPGGTAAILRTGTGLDAASPADDTFSITLTWRDRTRTGDNEVISQVWEFQP
jgi:type IV pilus assembly protein PilV